MVIIAVLVVIGAAIVLVHFATDIDVNLFLADPAEIAHLPFYTGAMTYLGAFALLSACAVCGFAASLIPDRLAGSSRASFLLSLGLLVAWLGLDDLLMFHEWAGLAIAELLDQADIAGARSRLEGIVFVAYGLAWMAWAGVFRHTILSTHYVLLFLGLAGLAMSVAIDVGMFLFPSLIPDTAWMPTTLSVAEEMLKLGGILFLSAYAIESSRGAIRAGYARAYGR